MRSPANPPADGGHGSHKSSAPTTSTAPSAPQRITHSDPDYRFDPERLFLRVTKPESPTDVAAIKGVIRGPLGGDALWNDRSPVLPMSREVRCFGGSSNMVGSIGSLKMAAMLGTESGRETDLIRLLDWAPNVKKIETQGEPVEYRLFGRRRRTTPDCVVDLHVGRRHLLEVKPIDKAQSAEFLIKAHAITTACARRGVIYGVLTELFIRQQPRLQNIKLLRRYRTNAISKWDWELIATALASGALTIDALTAKVRTSREQIYAAIYRNLLVADLAEAPLTGMTLVTLA